MTRRHHNTTGAPEGASKGAVHGKSLSGAGKGRRRNDEGGKCLKRKNWDDVPGTVDGWRWEAGRVGHDLDLGYGNRWVENSRYRGRYVNGKCGWTLWEGGSDVPTYTDPEGRAIVGWGPTATPSNPPSRSCFRRPTLVGCSICMPGSYVRSPSNPFAVQYPVPKRHSRIDEGPRGGGKGGWATIDEQGVVVPNKKNPLCWDQNKQRKEDSQ
jgi:hypothetical protein